MKAPKWTLYLGRKTLPSVSPFAGASGRRFSGFAFSAESGSLAPTAWEDQRPPTVDCLLDWEPTSEQPEAPDDALIWYDVPLSFEPPSHQPRFVMRRGLGVGDDDEVPAQNDPPRPQRTRADYGNTEYKKRRQERLDRDHKLCLFCKSPATTVQHITYRRAGGNEETDDLRSLCRLCHDAVTMLEYGLGIGLDRINPEEPALARHDHPEARRNHQIPVAGDPPSASCR